MLDDFGAKRRKQPAAIPKDQATDPETNEPPAKQQPAKFEKWQQVMLDEIFLQCNGKPQSETLDKLSKTIKIGKDKVRLFSPGFRKCKMLTRLFQGNNSVLIIERPGSFNFMAVLLGMSF